MACKAYVSFYFTFACLQARKRCGFDLGFCKMSQSFSLSSSTLLLLSLLLLLLLLLFKVEIKNSRYYRKIAN